MADTADKPKEKKKKKSTGSTKEKEKKGSEKSSITDPKKTEKPEEQLEQSKTTQQKSEEEPKTSEVKSTGQPKPHKTPKGTVEDKRPSITEDCSTYPDQIPPNAAQSRPETATTQAEEMKERDFVLSDISDQPLVQPEYSAPPAATKKDVDLLKDLDEAKLEELREAFELFDLDQDGIINSEDLRLTFVTLGQLDIPDTDIKQMLSETIGPLDFESFVILLGYKTIELDPEAVLTDALSRWDYDNSGLISEERIKHDLMTWGDKFTLEEADLALDDAPICMQKGTAMIDYIKFCNTLSGLRKKTKMPGPEDFMSKT